MIELLAPAGSLECGVAGIHYGADAVYLGMPQFSARADATNLTLDELAVLVGIAHGETPRRKVYVTINTLLRQDEIPSVVSLLGALYDAGVDGLIVQDASLIGLVRRYFPKFALHASTQMVVHNLEGARQAKAMGFSRVVLSRELSVPEITDIAKKSGIEVEVFIHGALCYSYSGLCLLSAAINGNSGNRGSCTYICRNKLKVQNAAGKVLDTCCPMSMKDLAVPDMLPMLEKAGVASLKIEGRKKTPLYVAAVTNYYRRLLDGTFNGSEQADAELDVKTIFSRPWTKFFMQNTQASGITDTKHLGPRGIDVGSVNRVRKMEDGTHRLRFVVKNRPIEKHDGLQIELTETEKPFGFPVTELLGFTQAGQDKWSQLFEAPVGTTVEVPLPAEHPEFPAGARIFCTSSQAVKRKYEWPEPRPAICRNRLPVQVKLSADAGSLQVECSCRCLNAEAGAACPMDKPLTVKIQLEAALSPAQKPDRVKESACQAFGKMGDTEYRLDQFQLVNPHQLFLPVSLLNEARRQALEALDAERGRVRQAYVESVLADVASREVPAAVTEPRLILKIDQPFYLNLLSDAELARADELVFSVGKTAPEALESTLNELTRRVPREKVRISVPVLSRPQVTPYQWKHMVPDLMASGWRRYEIGNIGALSLFPDMTAVDVTGDWSLYAMNMVAARTWLTAGVKGLALCPEDSEDNMGELLQMMGDRMTVVIYQDTILARSAVCIMKSINGFCPGRPNCKFKTPLLMTRHDGVQLTAVNDNCTTLMLQTPPKDLISQMPLFKNQGAGAFRVDFVGADYAPTAVQQVWRRVLDNR